MAKTTDPGQLPVYRVQAAPLDEGALVALGRALFGWKGRGHVTSHDGTRLRVRSGTQVVETHVGSGGVWAEDEAALWEPDLAVDLVSPAGALARARGLVARLARAGFPAASTRGQPVRWTRRSPVRGSRVRSTAPTAKERTPRALDRHVVFDAALRAGRAALGASPGIPVVGGGGRLHVTLGHGGRVVAFSGVWRPVVGVEGRARIRPRAEVLAAHRRHLREAYGKEPQTQVSAHLAYACAPAMDVQTRLVPVWVLGEAWPARGMRARIATVAADPEWAPWRRGVSRGDRKGGLPRRPPWGRRWTAGAHWMNLDGDGELLCGQDVRGFAAAAREDGATVRFEAGDEDADRRMWLDRCRQGVDAVDLVFYAGHAGPDGWMLAPEPPSGARWVRHEDTGPAVSGARWGSQETEWIVIAGCGPLQDGLFTPGGGDAMARWAAGSRQGGAFQGLHALLGYASASYATAHEGRAFVEYARDGKTLGKAWLRTARETQSTLLDAAGDAAEGVWAAGLFARRRGVSAWGDHLWGHGSVCEDPFPATSYTLLGASV